MEEEGDVTILPRTLDLVFWLVSLVPVICLLLWDVWKAWKRRAFWIPGQALVLSALTIQLVSFIDYAHISVYSGSGYQTKEVVAILVKNQLVIDSGRLMMCVLIAYLLPGMARSGSITGGSNLAALALSITFHVVSELRSIWKVEKRNESLSAPAALSDGIFSVVCSTILIAAIIYLLLLLIRATMIGKSIRRIMSQKIPSALSCCCTPGHPPGCNETKDHVLKCCIVARLSQPDYVLARSGLLSMALPIVTACIVIHVINWRYVQFTDLESLNSVTKRTLVLFVIVGQFVIVLIGWIVLFVRGVTSCMHGNIVSGDYSKSMSIEDALTDLTACFIRTASFMRLFDRDKRIQEKKIREMNKKIRDIFSMLNPPRWLTSIKRSLSRIKKRVIESVPIAVLDDSQFSMYEETLKMLLIPGESAQSLWKANQWGFRKVKRYMEQGQEDGKCSPRELTGLLMIQTGSAAEPLQQANKNSWKRTAVSLIHLMIYYYNDTDASSAIEDASVMDALVIEKAMQCYIQGWEYMNFFDGLNDEVKSLGQQADEEFDSLQHSWNKRGQPGMLEREIRGQLESLSNEARRNLQNSRDWTEVAKYCLLETWRVMDLSAAQINKINVLQRELANVYFVYMKEGLKAAVLQKCSKLAEEGMEEEILDVAFLSAKAQGLLDKVRKRHNTDQRSISSHIPTVNEQVGKGHNTDQASTSSHILTVSEQADKGKGQAELPPEDLNQSSYVAVGKGDGIRSRRPTETAVAVEEGISCPKDSLTDDEAEFAAVGNNRIGNKSIVGNNSIGSNYSGNNSMGNNNVRLRRTGNNTGNYSMGNNSGDDSIGNNTGSNYSMGNNNVRLRRMGNNTGNYSMGNNSGNNTGNYSMGNNTGNYSMGNNSGNNNVRLCRPNNSFTDQTEIAAALQDLNPWRLEEDNTGRLKKEVVEETTKTEIELVNEETF